MKLSNHFHLIYEFAVHPPHFIEMASSRGNSLLKCLVYLDKWKGSVTQGSHYNHYFSIIKNEKAQHKVGHRCLRCTDLKITSILFKAKNNINQSNRLFWLAAACAAALIDLSVRIGMVFRNVHINNFWLWPFLSMDRKVHFYLNQDFSLTSYLSGPAVQTVSGLVNFIVL